MSTNNIVEKFGTAVGGLIIAFETRDGDTRYYRYTGSAALAVSAGYDPSGVSGEEISEEEAQAAKVTSLADLLE